MLSDSALVGGERLDQSGMAMISPSPGPAPVISLRDVTKQFPGTATPAVSSLSLDITEGEVAVFVGPSGCGKTTTLKMINRLIEPTSGTIEVLGRPNDAVPAAELRRQIGYVIQQIGLFPHRTIERNIGVVPELIGWDKARTRDRTRQLVELVGLPTEVLERYPSELSGGQQQRVGVARALAADPPILLMDEPYSAVDPLVRERLQDELLALQEKVGKTIVVVTHDIEEALKLGDRVAVFETGGRLAQYDRPDEILRAPPSAFVSSFLGRERGLRRLGLLRVRDIDLEEGPVVHPGQSVAAAIDVAAAHGTQWAAVVDDGALVGWLPLDDLRAAVGTDPIDALATRDFVATVTSATPLREALDLIVRSHTRRAAVVDDRLFVGMATIDTIAGGLE